MGVYTVPEGGTLKLYSWPGPSYIRPKITALTGPTLNPVSPAVDVRELASVDWERGTYSMQVASYVQTLKRYAAGADPVEDDPIATVGPYTTAADDALVRYIIPSGTADDILVLEEYAIDVVGVPSDPISSDGDVIVSGVDAPLFTVTPAQTGTDTNVGTLRTCDGGTVTGTPTPAITYQWRRSGTAISGATSATYTLVQADFSKTVDCQVTATNTGGTKVAVSNGIVVTSTTITFPAYVPRSQFRVRETSTTTGIDGTRDVDVGEAAGGSAVSIPAGFTLFVWSSLNSGGNLSSVTIDSTNTVTGGSGTFARTTSFPVGTVLYHGLGWRHDATGTLAYATDQSDTETISGNSYPYDTVVIQGSGPPVDPSDRLAALGTPSDAFKTAAVNAVLCGANGSNHTNADSMNSVYSGNSMVALGFAVLKGDTGAALNQAVAQVKKWLNPNSTPLNRSGYGDNVATLGSFLLLCMKIKGWPGFNADEKTTYMPRADACMKVGLFSSAFVMSDSSPFSGMTICGWGGPANNKGKNQRTTAPNQSLMGPCHYLIALAYFGSYSAAKAILDAGAAALRTELEGVGFNNTNLHNTMNWRNINHTTPIGLTVGGASDDAPTDDQIAQAVGGNSLKYYDVPLSDFHQILAMATYKRPSGSNHTPWIANGSYGDGKYGGNPAVPNGTQIKIGRGWGGLGLDSAGQPVTTANNAVAGCLRPSSRDDPPGNGLVGGPAELMAWTDEGRRSSPSYMIDGMRPLVAAWGALWVSGLLNLQNSDVQAVLPIMNRAVKFAEYVHVGYVEYDHKNDSIFPPNKDWQIANLYKTWTEVLGPALGL